MNDRQEQRRPRSPWPVRILAQIAVSYALDTALLSLFAWSGAVASTLAVAYGVAATAICGIFLAMFLSGANEQFRDRNLTLPHMLVATLLQLACAAAAPQLAFFFLNVLFIIFAFGTLRVTVPQAASALLFAAVASVALGYDVRDEIAIPHATTAQVVLVWLSCMLTLARCMFVGLYGRALRASLDAQNKRLASATEQIERLATRDDLTGALNRRSMMSLIEEQVRLAARTRQRFSVVMLDLDHFKSVNDRYGHTIGDDVLRAFAEAAQSTLRASDRLGRYGGEEFLLMLAAETSEGAAIVAERLRAAVAAKQWQTMAAGLEVTVSCGVALLSEGESAADLIKRADAALYDAKRLGRNRVVFAAEPSVAKASTGVCEPATGDANATRHRSDFRLSAESGN